MAPAVSRTAPETVRIDWTTAVRCDSIDVCKVVNSDRTSRSQPPPGPRREHAQDCRTAASATAADAHKAIPEHLFRTPRHGATPVPRRAGTGTCLSAPSCSTLDRSSRSRVSAADTATWPPSTSVTLDVPRGTILGVIGPSGSGKTTLIRMLTGTLEPTGGGLSVLGQQPRKFTRQAREQLGYMPQHFVLYEELTTAGKRRRSSRRCSVCCGPSAAGASTQVLKLVDLWEVRDRRARQLSGGMQRRLELACALVHDPRAAVRRRADRRARPDAARDGVGRVPPTARHRPHAGRDDPDTSAKPSIATPSPSWRAAD